MRRMTHRQLILELEERLKRLEGEPDKAECLRWKAKRVFALPGARPLVVGVHEDGRNEYVLNVGQCRQLLQRLKGGPNV